MLRLFDEIQCLLGISKLPRDIQIGVTLSLEHLKIAQKEWQEIHRQNEEKRIIAEEEEKVNTNLLCDIESETDDDEGPFPFFVIEFFRLKEMQHLKRRHGVINSVAKLWSS